MVFLYTAFTGKSLLQKRPLSAEDLRQALTVAASQRVTALVGRGKIFQAIRAYQEETGAEMADAKDVVDQLSVQQLYHAEYPSAADAVLGAIQHGRTLEAIRLYRQQTGLGLAEAKRAIEHFELRQLIPLPPPQEHA